MRGWRKIRKSAKSERKRIWCEIKKATVDVIKSSEIKMTGKIENRGRIKDKEERNKERKGIKELS